MDDPAPPDHAFAPAERAAVYRAIRARRDCRHFLPDPLPDALIGRLLAAAHHAPSVGFMQPWNFLLIRSEAVRRRIKAAFERANALAADHFPGDRGDQYRSLKLEGLLEAPLNLCITCDRSRHGPAVLGRTIQPEMDLYSTVCAVQNLWLAAASRGSASAGSASSTAGPALNPRTAGFGRPVAYLCLGRVPDFPPEPELQRLGWLDRIDLAPLVFEDRWGRPGALDAGGTMARANGSCSGQGGSACEEETDR